MIRYARFMSIQGHLGKTQSRKDDIESIGYLLIYFLKGKLPWQNIDATCGNRKGKFKKIKNAKLKCLPGLVEELPSEFKAYFEYVKKLNYDSGIDYEYLKNLFHGLFEKRKFRYDCTDFDWDKLPGGLPNDVCR